MAKIKINVENKEAVEKVDQVTQHIHKAQQAAKNVKIGGTDSAEGIKEATKQLNEFKRIAVTGVGKQVTSAFSAVGKALLSPLGAAIVAAELLVKIFKSYWENTGMNAKKQKMNIENNIALLKQEQEASEKKWEKEQEAFKVLQDINSSEKLNNSERQQAIYLVNMLNSSYEGLGLTIDEATGKVENLNEAIFRAGQAQRKRQIQLTEQLIENQKKVIDSSVNEIFTNEGFAGIGEKGFSLMDNDIAWNFTSYWERWKKALDDASGFGETPEIYKHLDEINQAFADAGDDFTKRMRVLQEKVYPLLQDQDFKSALGQLFGSQAWKDMEEYTSKLQSLQNTEGQAMEALNKFRVANKKLTEEYKKQKDALKQLEEWKKKHTRDKEFEAADATGQAKILQDEIKAREKEIVDAEKALQAEKAKEKSVQTYTGNIENIQKALNSNKLDSSYREELSKDLQQYIAKQNDAQTKINESKKKQVELQTKIKDLTIQNIESEDKIGKITEENAKKTKSFYQSMTKNTDNKIAEITGEKYKKQVDDLKKQFKEAFKRDPNDQQLATMQNQVNLNALMDQYNEKPNEVRMNIKTNDLAARGGFASSVVVDGIEMVEKQQLAVQKRQEKLLSDMKDLQSKNNKALEALGVIS